MKLNGQSGFIQILVGVLIASLIVVGSIAYTQKKVTELEHEVEYAQKLSLGATVTSTALSDTIGTFRTNVNGSLDSLNHALSDSTSSDPGHTHTLTSGTTGTLAIARGGTATTTFARGLVTASGTDAFGSLQTNGAGSIPIASGTGWVANTITAGTNITITNNPGTISVAASVGNVYAGATTTNAVGIAANAANGTLEETLATTTISAGTMSSSSILKVTGFYTHNGADSVNMRVKYGGTTFFSATSTKSDGLDSPGQFTVFIVNTSTTAAQIGEGMLYENSPSTAFATTTIGIINYGGSPHQTISGSVNSAAQQNLIITKKYNTSGGASTFVLLFYIVEVINPS